MVGFPSKFMNHYNTINPFSSVITLNESNLNKRAIWRLFGPKGVRLCCNVAEPENTICGKK
jgi:hypothetical protein